MIEMVNDTMEYYDDAVCLQSGIYRQADISVAHQNKVQDMLIIPNPASQQIEIILKGKMEGLCHITIINMVSEKAIEEQMACEQQSKKLDVSKLAPGVYTVKVYNDSFAKAAKLVISR